MIEENISQASNQPKVQSKADFIVAIIVNIILLYLVRIIRWQELAFITEEITAVLSIFQLSLVTSITANILFLYVDNIRIQSLVKIAVNFIGMYFLFLLAIVYPFRLSAFFQVTFLDTVMRLAIYAGIFGLGIATIVEVVRLFTGRR